jgi:O-antigen/teichoic acid export membrane protein
MPEEEALVSLKTIAKGASIVFVGMLFSKAALYFYRLIVARIGVEEYGLLSLGFAVFSFAAMFASLGLGAAVGRYLPIYLARRDYARLRGLLSFSTKALVVLGLLAGAVIFLASDFLALEIFHNARLSLILKIFSFAAPFYVLSDLFSGMLQGLQQPKRFAAVKYFAESAFKVIGTILLILLGYGFFGAITVYAASYVLSFCIGLYFVEKTFPFVKSVKRIRLPVGEWLGYSFPLALAGLFSYSLGWADSILLGALKDATQTGIYNAALPTATLLLVIPGAVSAFHFPITSSLLAKKKIRELRNVHKITTKWIWLLNLPIAFAFVFFAPQILAFLFGKEYYPGTAALVILTFGYLINSIFATSANEVMALGKSRVVLYSTIVASVLNIILNYVFIQAWGIAGAALATTISLFVWNAIYGVLAYRLVGTKPFSIQCLKGFFAGLLACVVVYGLMKTILGRTIIDLLAAGVVLIAVYAACLLLLKVWEREDAELLKAIEKKMGFRFGFLRWFK